MASHWVLCVAFCWLLGGFRVYGQLTWQRVETPDGPVVREAAGLGYDTEGRRLIMFGGKSKGEILNDTWIFTVNDSTWQQLTLPVAPPSRFSYVFGSRVDGFYIATGEGHRRIFYNDIWKFDFGKNKWEELPSGGQEPERRYGAAGGIHHNSSTFYVTMGFSGDRYSNTYSYNLDSPGWTLESKGSHSYRPNSPHARCLKASAMVSPEEIVIYGGCLSGGGTGGSCPAGDSWKFSGSSKTWTPIPGCASPRQRASMAMLPMGAAGETRGLMYGGEEEGRQVLLTTPSPADEVSILDPVTDTWTQVKTQGTAPNKMAAVALATGAEGVYLFGGLDVESGVQSGVLYLLSGDAGSAMNATTGGSCGAAFFNLPALHGIFMFIAWGVLLPGGVFVARHLRHKDPLWFKLHRIFQVSGLVVATVGLLCAVVSVQFAHFRFLHGGLGLAIMLVGLLQPLNAFFRPHVPPAGEMKPQRRVVWEWCHRCLGSSAVLLALINISLGLFLVMATQAIWIVWFVYFSFVVITFFVAEVRKCYKERSTKL